MSGTSTSYTGRQVDLELLQSIAVPSPLPQEVTLSNVTQIPKVVTGIEKAVQRYTQLLLTTPSDIHFGQTLGGYLISSILQGGVGDQGALSHLFCVTSASALKSLAGDDLNPSFGTIPDDERIVAAALQSLDLSPATQTISLSVLLTTAAGSSYTFVVPISTAG